METMLLEAPSLESTLSPRPKRRTLLWQCIVDLVFVALIAVPPLVAAGIVIGLKAATAKTSVVVSPSIAAFSTILFGLAMAGVALRRMNRDSIGWAKQPSGRWIRDMGGAFLAMIAMNITYSLFLQRIHAIGGVHDPVRDLISRMSGWPLYVLIGYAVLGAPVAEELLYRGCMFGRFQVHGYAIVGAVTSALFFSLSHGVPPMIPIYFTLGLATAWLYQRTGSLWPSIALHALNNALAVGLALMHKG